jgi:type III secretion protein Q
LAQGDSSLDEIPVDLVFEAGRVEMSVAEVDRLAPGTILQLDRTAEDAIDIVVNGRKIGRGGLVKVGEMLCVRVTRLNADG